MILSLPPPSLNVYLHVTTCLEILVKTLNLEKIQLLLSEHLRSIVYSIDTSHR